MPGPERPRIMLDLLEEHLEQLDALWRQRESVVFAPGWSRGRLGEIEERAEAHVDALRLGGEHSVGLARPALAGEESGAATAATFALVLAGGAEGAAEAVAALAGGPPPVREGVRLGLRHCDLGGARGALAQVAAGGDPAARAAACDVLAFQRAAPPPFADLLEAADPGVRRLAIAAAGRAGGPWRPEQLEEILRGGDRALMRTALETSARLGMAGLAASIRRAAAQPEAPEALAFLGVLGDPADLPLLLDAALDPGRAPDALAALGALGAPAAIPRIIELMDLESPRTALAAGAAFVRITGATGIEADEPPPPPDDLSDGEKDLWEAPGPADFVLARGWWAQHGRTFAAGRRWQAGLDVSEPRPDLLDALPLDARRDVYLGARAARSRQVPDIELEAATRPLARVAP